MFYTYVQNNSGGDFVQDLDRGIAHYVIVEARTPEEADSRATEIGLYFDGCDTGDDCPCCGDRWDRQAFYAGRDEGEVVPSIYGQLYAEFVSWIRWMEPDVVIHFLDGTRRLHSTMKRDEIVEVQEVEAQPMLALESAPGVATDPEL